MFTLGESDIGSGIYREGELHWLRGLPGNSVTLATGFTRNVGESSYRFYPKGKLWDLPEM